MQNLASSFLQMFLGPLAGQQNGQQNAQQHQQQNQQEQLNLQQLMLATLDQVSWKRDQKI
jgi:hypothetical protein